MSEKRDDETVTAFTLRRIREDIIEECAKIAEPWSGFCTTDTMGVMDREIVKVRNEIAAAIRALQTGPSTHD